MERVSKCKKSDWRGPLELQSVMNKDNAPLAKNCENVLGGSVFERKTEAGADYTPESQ